MINLAITKLCRSAIPILSLFALLSINWNTSAATKLDCKRLAQIDHPVNLSTGVYTEKAQVTTPLTINLPAQVDNQRYYDCLVRNQLVDSDNAEKFLANQDRCRQQIRITDKYAETASGKIGGQLDSEAFRDCMAEENNIEVEVEIGE